VVVGDEAAVVVGPWPFAPPRQVFTNVARAAPVRLFASACLLQAFRDMGFTGTALAPLGVAVVRLGGASAAKAAAQQSKATAARAAVIFIQVSSSSGFRLHVAAAHTLDGEACRRHEAGIKNASRGLRPTFLGVEATPYK
jgi:hypothetical protein